MKNRLQGLLLVLALILALIGSAGSQAQAETIIYLVRHTEPVSDDSGDAVLNPVGRARADWLAGYFDDRGVSRIFSTKTNRTMETATPTAERLNIGIENYDGRKLEEIAEVLKAIDGVVLVSGHSNTTPSLVNHLVGEPRFQWLQHYQYDFIFRVHLTDDGGARVSIEHSLPRSVYGDHPLER